MAKLWLNLETNQDTLAASCFSLTYANNYMNGAYYLPHYPVPVPVDSLTHEAALWYTNHDKWWDYRIEKRRRGEGDRP